MNIVAVSWSGKVCFQTTLDVFGFGCIVVSPRLVGWRRRSGSSSHHMCLLLDVAQTAGGTLSRQQQLALSTVPQSNCSWLENVWFSCRKYCVYSRICVVFVAGLASFPVGNMSFRTLH